ncbi:MULTISPECIES: exodeoxyribonuclease VII small subunit [Campylobacter]|jgi:exonuclease VII small subunit|uniref:Exodeoxyribonuclease VII small subunit n=1 Tax=Campylobacter hominis (strain ATCC BAA-381 / DSM 21671 / CCUG 45161 / LMG 19568 / NCTC 13146 / CH001A) TaxID=360107 RepID=A7I1T1_CAMHC|nr:MULTISPECIES: exodeoxyribonuclease VII small subunit [Campylobacter]ABS50933.1 conserved domain protein [Campylobacter hominis ATCC BAA-381]MCI6642147.1 exodeoxyribonuclease VII small subunit [Campylobacter sp.]MDD7422258.1 exodeoxyribonuclease VII small subunit [Campylobacter hominis]MDY3116681.1 exodeoxyribonuclease VII small subunit [Campylobacter hominis]UAK86242.1 exodeoxyribonuclease VII small subunit [Campylobacter hominis]
MQDLTENFETKLNKIDVLLKKLDDENLTLKQSVEFYKNGVKLIKEARDLLEKAKLEVTEIQNESAQ